MQLAVAFAVQNLATPIRAYVADGKILANFARLRDDAVTPSASKRDG